MTLTLEFHGHINTYLVACTDLQLPKDWQVQMCGTTHDQWIRKAQQYVLSTKLVHLFWSPEKSNCRHETVNVSNVIFNFM